MHAGEDRLEFAPPAPPAAIRALGLAILAHLLLMAALTWGITWKKDTEEVSAEAELWSAVPREAAPPPPIVQAPPPPPQPVVVQPPAPVEPAPVEKAPDIALEQEKRKRELEEQKRELIEQKREEIARQKREAVAQQKLAAASERKAQLEREKKLEARRKQDALEKKQLADEKAAKEEKDRADKDKLAKAAREKQGTKQLAKQREENIARMMKSADAGNGAPSATGNAAQSSGVSGSYGGRIQARVKPNIVFPDDIEGNPTADVEVRMSPDGTIVGTRLVKSSGNKLWDEAVIRALAKTEVLPRDTDGRVKTPLVIGFSPKSR